MIVKYILAWLPMVVIGIINGVIREQWYGVLHKKRKIIRNSIACRINNREFDQIKGV